MKPCILVHMCQCSSEV